MHGTQKGSTFRPHEPGAPEIHVAIVGGGPGGMFAAWQLAAKVGPACRITILEGSDRLGGKIVTREFPGAGLYEAGVAEIYDYSRLGPDPLRQLIENDLGLDIKHIAGGSCILDGKILPDADALAEHFGAPAAEAAKAFRARCAELLSPGNFYQSAAASDNLHDWATTPASQILADEIPDEVARHYIRTMTHSDVAAPPHLTNGLNFLKNVLMDVDGYMDVYSVLGGNEAIVRRLAEELDADVRFNRQVRSIEHLDDGRYRLEAGGNGVREVFFADYVVLALPLTALSIIDWRSASLRRAMLGHVGYFDRPGHYLRATLLFERPFWREHISGAWWMLDAFDGCCVYDEGARHDLGGWGALGFLIAGNAALGLANMSDERIEQLCLDALPLALEHGRELLVDCRVHRWLASVNAVPGGWPGRGLAVNHRPDATNHPRVVAVGDYMFDATLNGVLDSADAATEFVVADLLMSRRSARAAQRAAGGGLLPDYFARYRNQGSYEEVWAQFFDAEYIAALLKSVWRLAPGARILDAGSASGYTVGALRALGFDAWGIENDAAQHARTPIELRPYNLLGDVGEMPFPDRHFDVVIETCLCHVSRRGLRRAMAELGRVSRGGLMLGSVVSDLAIDVVERFGLLTGVETFRSRWEWSEALLAHGFTLALADHADLLRSFDCCQAAGAGLEHRFEDAESMMYAFYVAPAAVRADVDALTPVAAELVA